MSLSVSKWHFDHISVVSNTRAPALAALARLLGLSDGYRPPFAFSGNWFYQEDSPVLHAIHRPDGEEVELNHIAFRSEMPLPVLLQHIQTLQLPYQLAHVPEQAIAQVFIRFSDSLLLELDVPDSREGRAIDTTDLIKE